MNKPGKSFPRPLAEVLHRTLNAAFAKQGFASTEIVTRWADIVGADIADHSEPEKILWPRPSGADLPEPGVLVLRVEGPVAIEIQHLSGVVLERVNRFFGWRAVGALRLRQAPLSRRKQTPQRPVDKDAAARVAAHLTEITDENLRAALARLGAALKES
ncbi:MAG TPA: DciA family protein [Xanthobacteraceae bacterium]|nr:DciA family protein [Xanthobacteraceae bacterium]